MTNNKEIATEILRQLGGNKFTVMTGAKNFIAIENGLTFRLPSNFAKNKINVVRIVLEPSDTYTVTFLSMRGTKINEVSKHDGIYNDMLVSLFSKKTGLDTSL